MLDILPNWIGKSMEDRVFVTNPALHAKVKGKNLRPFFGNTIILDLSEKSKESLKVMQEELCEAAGDMLVPLDFKSFHMTIHDLINGPVEQAILADMEAVKPKAQELVRYYRENHPVDLNMVTTARFNMSHTSIVQGLMPIDDPSWDLLDEMYEAAQNLSPKVFLSHPMTPHITLAYFKPGTYQEVYRLEALRNLLGKWEHAPMTLSVKDLHYAEFSDMNTYRFLDD